MKLICDIESILEDIPHNFMHFNGGITQDVRIGVRKVIQKPISDMVYSQVHSPMWVSMYDC